MTKHGLPSGGQPSLLSPQEAADLAAQVSAMAKAGLPLEQGLRALADEVPNQRLSRALRAMGNQLAAGAPLDVVLQNQAAHLPAHVRGLLLAGVRSGRLAEALEEFVDLERSRIELRRRVWVTLAYPTLLLVLLLGVFVLIQTCVVSTMAKVYQDFDAELPYITDLAIAMAGPRAWISAAVVIAPLMGALLLTTISGRAWAAGLLHRVPLVGPLWRWHWLAHFSRMMAVLLDCHVPLAESLRLAGASVRDGSLARGCRRLAADVEAGCPLADSIGARRRLPASLAPLVEWGERTGALPDAFRASMEMFLGRVHTQGVLLEAVLVPLSFLLVMLLVGFFVIALLMPMISLIQKLT